MSQKAAFVYSHALTTHVLRPDHPLKPVRLLYTYQLLEGYGAFDGEESALVEPRPATEDEIRAVHEAEYVEAVKSLGRGEAAHDPARFNFHAAGDNPIYQGMYEASALSTGASLVAAELVNGGRAAVAFSISGGLHHAAAGHASGFCIFNDPAIAIQYLLARGMKVAYVDIDAHHGDGVQGAFYDTDRVMTISVHESGRYLFPGTGFVDETGTGPGRGFSVNLPLFPNTGDDTYLWAFREVVTPLLGAFKPDILVTQLGIDSYFSDPLTHLRLTSRGFTAALREFAAMGLPWLAMGGGGYDLDAVARCWTLAYGVMLGREWPDQLPPGYQLAQGPDGGPNRLRDGEDAVSLPESTQAEARAFAEESVRMVQRHIFPIHSLR